jgi:hypothetical protein
MISGKVIIVLMEDKLESNGEYKVDEAKSKS